MRNLLLLSMLAILEPTAARAEPVPAEPDDIEIDCEHRPACVAAEFADALALQPVASQPVASQPVASQVQRPGSVIAFEPGRARVYSKDREKLMALAASWRKHIGWAAITVEGDAGASSDVALARRRADKISDYLIRYGVAAEYVVAIAHEHVRGDARNERGPGGHVDLTIALCDRTSDACRPKRRAAPVGAADAEPR
jgi:hypothetical protein